MKYHNQFYSNQVKRKKCSLQINELSTEVDGPIDKAQKAMIITMFQQNGLYFWMIFMMGVFYGLPAIQLVLKYQEAISITGDNDLCYYNSLCSIPVNDVQDFNHILSNIGYMAFGLTFLFIVSYRYIKDFLTTNRWQLTIFSKEVHHEYVPHH